MTLAIDFDGVIHDYKHPVEGKRMGAPFEGTYAVMRTFKRQKHTLIVHTVKATTPQGTQIVEDWLKYYKIPYDSVTATKPNADVYIDDRAYRHDDWMTTLGFITSYMRLQAKPKPRKVSRNAGVIQHER